MHGFSSVHGRLTINNTAYMHAYKLIYNYIAKTLANLASYLAADLLEEKVWQIWQIAEQ